MMRRKTFLAAAAGAAAIGASACAHGDAKDLEIVEPASQFSYAALKRLVDKAADVRQLWDVGSNPPAALSAMTNALNGYQFGYGITPNRIALVACLHNAGNIAAYDDTVWKKYNLGDVFGVKDRSGNSIQTNIFAKARVRADRNANPNDPAGMYQAPTLETLQRRGVVVLLCHTGAAEQARVLSANGAQEGMTPEGVLHDLLAHVIPGVFVVPSAVATIGLLQSRFHYSYTSVTS
jgi:hypothetical protein